MKELLQRHSDAVLAVSAIVFAATIVAYGVLSIGNLNQQAEQAFSAGSVKPVSPVFNLKAAAALDLRGLMPASAGQ